MSFHLTEAELFAELEKRSCLVPLGSSWYHRKNPAVSYTIIDLFIDEATDQVSVVYEQPTGIRFVRRADVFIQEVDYSVHKKGSRFVRVS